MAAIFKISLTLVILLLTGIVSCGANKRKTKNNYLYITSGRYFLKNEAFATLFPIPALWKCQVIGVAYDRTLIGGLRLHVAYSEWAQQRGWNRHWIRGVGEPYFILGFTELGSKPDIIGSISFSGQYKFADAGLAYTYAIGKHHEVTLGLNFGLAYSGDDIVDTFYVNTFFPGFDEVLIESHGENNLQMGMVPNIKYNFVFWHNRLSAGWDMTWRSYSGIHKNQLTTGLQIGYKF